MARRRGFFAELQHQAAVAERNRQRAHVAAVRDANRQQQDLQRKRAAAERANVAAGRADSRAQAAAAREAKALHAEAQQAEAEALTAELGSVLSAIDGVLAWTLEVDNHVDLTQLRQAPVHPPFHSLHQRPIPAPEPVVAPSEPVFNAPPAPVGITSFFKKKEHAAKVERERAAFAARHHTWQTQMDALPGQQHQRSEKHRADEAARTSRLQVDTAAYEAQCRQREGQAATDNAELADLIERYGKSDTDAVEEYCGIVFSNSIYPDAVSLGIDIEYHRAERELQVQLSLPRPDEVPATKAFKYNKAKDEIVETQQTTKEQRDRYTALVHHIVLRTVHEMWEADRAGHFATLALTAGVEHIAPATGTPTTTPLVALACDRRTFEQIDLARAMPAETLKHLNAVVSKNPHGLVPVPGSSGIRG